MTTSPQPINNPLYRADSETAELLTTSQVAQRLNCTPRTVTRLIRRGDLPASRLGAGRTAYRVAATTLLTFLATYAR